MRKSRRQRPPNSVCQPIKAVLYITTRNGLLGRDGTDSSGRGVPAVEIVLELAVLVDEMPVAITANSPGTHTNYGLRRRAHARGTRPVAGCTCDGGRPDRGPVSVAFLDSPDTNGPAPAPITRHLPRTLELTARLDSAAGE